MGSEWAEATLGEISNLKNGKGFKNSFYREDGQYPVWGQFWVNNHAHILTGKNGISDEHLYLVLKNTNIRPFVTGAVQPKVNQMNLKAIPFILPFKEVPASFGKLIGPVFAQIRKNSEESIALANVRDALLPKLISGELRVPDAEKLVEN